MLNKMSMLLATAAVVLGVGAANAGPYDQSNGPNSSVPQATSDQAQPAYGNGYNYGYDDGYARRERNDQYRADSYRHEVRYDRGAYYYGSDCNDNSAAGTVMGAIAGGLIGSAASHGNGGAVAGGVILGGLAGNSISHNMGCDDRRSAMGTYSQGFEGRIGHRYGWRNGESRSYGNFTPVREYMRDGNTCRDYRESGYSNNRSYNRNGTACRHNDGNWYME
jgi:surface antigen